MSFGRGGSMKWCVLIVCSLLAANTRAEDPKPTPDNTIHVQLAEPVKPQTFSRPLKFFLVDVVDRSGSAQPMMVFKPRGGIFLDHTPTEITRAGLETCLKSADMLAKDRDSADFLLTVYLFHFGLSDSFADFFGKVEFAVALKNPRQRSRNRSPRRERRSPASRFAKRTFRKTCRKISRTLLAMPCEICCAA